jgi:hypothetical protein
VADFFPFPASKLPEEQYLDPLIASVKVMVQNSESASNVLPSRTPPAHINLTGFSDSWVGALQASHYRTVGIVKKISITVIAFSGIWLFWYLYSTGKMDALPLADSSQHGTRSGFSPSRDSPPQAAWRHRRQPEYTILG